MKVVVFGASGGSGRATVEALLKRGDQVRAFVRRPEDWGPVPPGLELARGDVLEPADVEGALSDGEVVIVTLGIRESALWVRLFGSRQTRIDVRSAGTAAIIQGMKRRGQRRLIVQTTYGIGATEGRLPFVWRLIFSLLLRPQIADSRVQERGVRESGLDWTLVQPVALVDGPASGGIHTSTEGEVQRMEITRSAVGEFLAMAARDPRWVGQSVALSGA
ncbi:MAG: SDR family oxidoreductase [Deltaproteobacteria bacterium]|jgi:uncharacterized protein YbjT (DUF2867 family)|nr:SDR family oxidoreductase [Deltaproteobacteria bacterium]